MDQCRASNKNAYVWGYLSNLVERGVFKEIHLSFLPVGHTHFGPDRIASRISIGVRYRTVLSLAEFHDLIRRSHTPAPLVEHISSVADWRVLMNPTLNTQWTGARVAPQSGLCTIRPCTVIALAPYVADTASLHWRFSTDGNGLAVCQDKQISAVEHWSDVSYPFRVKFRETPDKRSGLTKTTLSSCLVVAPSSPIPDTRHNELTSYLKECSPRLPEDVRADLATWVTELATHRPGGDLLPWVDGGLFACELQAQPDSESDSEEVANMDGDELFRHNNRDRVGMYVRDQSAVMEGLQRQNEMRGQSLATAVHVGDFISYKPFYNVTVAVDQRKAFYVAKVLFFYFLFFHVHFINNILLQSISITIKVIALKPDDAAVQVKTYYTKSKPTVLLEVGKNVTYKIYNGPASVQDVLVADIFTVFGKLTSKGTLKAQLKRDIMRAITTKEKAAEDAAAVADQSFYCANGER